MNVSHNSADTNLADDRYDQNALRTEQLHVI